ncbi:MAG: hypothetical protein KA792_08680 [Bacteroidales bacterium]|nr:hypothetical protein [Bacteroidales bacterium]
MGKKKRVRVDIPIRQPDKMIELGLSVCNNLDSSIIQNENINLNNLHQLITNAKEKRAKYKELSEISKGIQSNYTECVGISKGQTKDTRGTIYSELLHIRDFLKNYYKGSEELLNNWGFDVEIEYLRDLRKVRIQLPINNPEKLVELAEVVYKQHRNDPKVLKEFNMSVFLKTIKKAKSLKADYNKNQKLADKALEEANNYIGIGYGQSKDTPNTIYYYLWTIHKELLIKYDRDETVLIKLGYKASPVNANIAVKGIGLSSKKIMFSTNQKPLIMLHLQFKGSKGKKIYISWGDGTSEKCNMYGHTTPNSVYHDYKEEGIYNIVISGDISRISYLDAGNNQLTHVEIPRNMKNLEFINIENNLIEDQQVLNNLILNLESASVFNGELNIAGINNCNLSGYGVIAKNKLINRGWEIISN